MSSGNRVGFHKVSQLHVVQLGPRRPGQNKKDTLTEPIKSDFTLLCEMDCGGGREGSLAHLLKHPRFQILKVRTSRLILSRDNLTT